MKKLIGVIAIALCIMALTSSSQTPFKCTRCGKDNATPMFKMTHQKDDSFTAVLLCTTCTKDSLFEATMKLSGNNRTELLNFMTEYARSNR